MRTRKYKGGRKRTLKAGKRKLYNGGRKKRRGGRKSYKGRCKSYKGGSGSAGIVGANTIPLELGGVAPGILCPMQYGQPQPRVTGVLGKTACGTS